MSTVLKVKREMAKRVVAIVGKIDIHSHGSFQEVYDLLRDQTVEEIQLECSGITHFESSGLGLLLILREKAAVRGKCISILNPSREAKLQFDIANTGKLIPILECVLG